MQTPPSLKQQACSWRGEALRSRPDFLQTLTQDEVDELLEAASSLGNLPIEQISRANFAPRLLTRRLSAIQDSLENASGAALLRGFPIDRLSEDASQKLFWGMMQHVGTPISQSAKGERIFHVRDEGYRLDDPRARGPNTRKRLSFHTDRCDVIAFLCVRQAKSGGENDLVSSAALYEEIRDRRPDLLAELMKPYDYHRHNVDLGNELPFCRQPIFSFCEGHFAGSFLRVLIERAYDAPGHPPMSELQREALDFLEAVAEEEPMHLRIIQEPGDVLLLNNWVTFHRRSEFEDHEDPARKRHILRIWLSVPNSRPIDPLFKENYGATQAGAIRGGMRRKSES